MIPIGRCDRDLVRDTRSLLFLRLVSVPSPARCLDQHEGQGSDYLSRGSRRYQSHRSFECEIDQEQRNREKNVREQEDDSHSPNRCFSALLRCGKSDSGRIELRHLMAREAWVTKYQERQCEDHLHGAGDCGAGAEVSLPVRKPPLPKSHGQQNYAESEKNADHYWR